MRYSKAPHRQEAAYFYRSADKATDDKMREWLIEQAEQHKDLADLVGEPELHLADPVRSSGSDTPPAARQATSPANRARRR